MLVLSRKVGEETAIGRGEAIVGVGRVLRARVSVIITIPMNVRVDREDIRLAKVDVSCSGCGELPLLPGSERNGSQATHY